MWHDVTAKSAINSFMFEYENKCFTSISSRTTGYHRSEASEVLTVLFEEQTIPQ